jgi:uncharacterized protein (TIGR03435 family)
MRVVGPQNGKYELRRGTMVDLIRTAYGVEADKVVGGPHWLEMDRFDVMAKVPPATTRDEVKPMLQALLVERFGLVARQEIKPVPGHAVTRGAGELKLKEAPGGVTTTCQQNIRSTTNNIQLTMACRGVSMASLAEQFTRAAANIGVTGPVVDGTGLAGTWDFDLAWTPAQLTASSGGPTFLDALKQLGLALEPKDVPMATITVDSVNRVPTANDAAAVAAAFPPQPPAEFEVGNVKPAAQGAKAGSSILPTGQVNYSAAPLRVLIALAWEVPVAASIIGPKTLDTALFDVVGKMSTTTPIDPQQVDREVVGQMMRKLLLEQLDLKVRKEDRPVTGHSLVLDGTHKLTKADPTVRTRCTDTTVSSTSSAGMPSRKTTCQNITMTEFAARLQQLGGTAAFPAPVLDETGLEGRWTFSLTFAIAGLTQALAAERALAGGGAGGLTASDPTGVLTLEEAINRQLGLKLRTRQRSAPVFVVEYVEDKPAN